ncbi:MAG TPA: peptidase M75 family protein [Gordonia polyisoprenivorans]|nr:iron uptake system protein EfeO [Gordonia polyisoprenivorans]OZC32360.1 peptidase M75 family protein [Gordonia polyisoprenivorans]QUD83313.1 peptidase M75 family protein [Gordonia polyisoprenivorans]UZF55744.1 EfeM/EfeO family lipoprotein [Gordonia polyisoprenivorans]HCS59581.1 peptidase M75 family protein [Gordonia polyisoprenivorans]
MFEVKRTLATPVAVVAVMVGVPAVLAACTSKDSGTGTIEVTSTADTCDLSSSAAQTGNVSFKVANSGSKVTEFYVYANNNRVLGEVENIGPGLSGNLTVEITDPGTYTVACKPGMVGTGIEKKITVSGEKKQKTDAPADVNAAKARYLDYVRGQAAGLQSQTEQFVAAVKSGDLAAARAEFGRVRTFYERIEPVAESFPDLDPAIDMRWDDTENGSQPFTGFHRIERYLWPPAASEIGDAEGQIAPADAANAKATDNATSIAEVADGLVADVTKLRNEIDKPDFSFETRQFVAGPQALIDEVARTKVNGEEDRYSHTDLWDFAANLDGSETLIAEMQPMISAKNPDLMNKITAQFADVRATINRFRDGDGYVTYTQVDAEQRKDLSNKIDALSASLSQVPGIVLGT